MPRESWRSKMVRPRARYTPNLTPLIDVLFLLLLFFLLGSKFRQAEGAIPGSLPRLGIGANVIDAGGVPPTNYNVMLVPFGDFRENAKYVLSGATVEDRQALYSRLEARRKAYGRDAEKVQVVIQPRGDVRWEFCVEAFNQAVRAGFTNIGFGLAN